MRDGFAVPQRESLDLKESGINTIIWATGYVRDFSMIEQPLTDQQGFLTADSGVTPHAGLYCVGMLWTPSIKPTTLAGVSESTRPVAEAIAARKSVSLAA